MKQLFLLAADIQPMDTGDYTGFTFFIGSMAMMAASAFFFLSLSQFDTKWRTSVLVSGLITFIAAVHYFYMRDYYGATGESPTFFRYVDWTLTVPLMCVEFFLILKVAGAKVGLMWKLIFWSVIMLVTGYFGEVVALGNPTAQWLWGLASGIAYFIIVYIIWFGEAKKLAVAAGGAVLKAHNILCWFVLVGWAIYPLGYILGTEGGLFGLQLIDDPKAGQEAMDVVYNIGDAINKIGFGLVIYSLAMASTTKKVEA
jgi:bacteriorhodopsin